MERLAGGRGMESEIGRERSDKGKENGEWESESREEMAREREKERVSERGRLWGWQ